MLVNVVCFIDQNHRAADVELVGLEELQVEKVVVGHYNHFALWLCDPLLEVWAELACPTCFPEMGNVCRRQ